MYKRKNIFHFTDIDSLISIILGERILCSSVKAKLPKNLDFLPGRHLAPIIMKNIIDSDNSVERLRVIIDSVAGAVIPIIVTSYLFSTTTSCKNRHHWRLYAKDKGCCLQLCASEIRSQINYVDEGKLNYDSRAFEHRYVKNFLHHLLENKIKSMSDRAARSFMRAVVFSKYIEYVDDTEYRFLFQDLISQDEYDRRKQPNETITPLSLPIIPEQLIQNIYFKSEGRRTEFLDRMGSTKEFWITKVKFVP